MGATDTLWGAKNGAMTLTAPATTPTGPARRIYVDPKVRANLNPDALKRVNDDPVKAATFNALQIGRENSPGSQAKAKIEKRIPQSALSGLNQDALNRVLNDPVKSAQFQKLANSRKVFDKPDVFERFGDVGRGLGDFGKQTLKTLQVAGFMAWALILAVGAIVFLSFMRA